MALAGFTGRRWIFLPVLVTAVLYDIAIFVTVGVLIGQESAPARV